MDRQQNAWSASIAIASLVTKDRLIQVLAMNSIRPEETPSRMVSSWNNNAVDRTDSDDGSQGSQKVYGRKSAASKVLNAAAHNVSESAHNLVDGAAHVAHSMLDRVLGHHRAVHDELLEKIRNKVIREENVEIKHSLEILDTSVATG